MRLNLNLLTRVAKRSKREHRHASIIFKNGTPRTFGFNGTEHHAEENAMVRDKNYKGAVMVNIRLTKAGKIGMAKPCPGCLDLLKEKKFRKVIYSTNHGTFEEIYL